MTQQIVAHKTEDGKIFEDEALAVEHENYLAALRCTASLLSSVNFPLNLSSFDVSDAAEHMVKFRDEYIRALNGLPPELEEGGEPHDNPDVEAADAEMELELESENEARVTLGLDTGEAVADAEEIIGQSVPIGLLRHVLDSDGADDGVPF